MRNKILLLTIFLVLLIPGYALPYINYNFGFPGATPVSGDWYDDGIGWSDVGVYSNGTWFLGYY